MSSDSSKKMYDEYEDETANREMPEMRARMDETDAGQTEVMSELQTAEVGHAVKMGYVYFLETEDCQSVKIGYSKQPLKRVNDLATLMPVKLIGCFPASVHTETWLHRQFHADHKIGEWFHSTARLRELIGTLPLLRPEEAQDWDVRKEQIPDSTLDFFRKQGSKGGKLGGKARAAKLTAAQRSEIARKAGLAGGRGRKKEEK